MSNKGSARASAQQIANLETLLAETGLLVEMETMLNEQSLEAMSVDTSTDEGLRELLTKQHQINSQRAVLELAQDALAKLKAEAQNEH